MAVSAGPRGKASDTTANASVTPPASANQRCRANRLIRLHSMDKTGDSQIAFGVKQVTFVTLPLQSESIFGGVPFECRWRLDIPSSRTALLESV